MSSGSRQGAPELYGAVDAGAAKVSDRVIETSAAAGLLRVRARALPLPAASAAALEVAAPVAAVLRRAADSMAAAAEPVVREQLDELREGVAAGADDAKVLRHASARCNDAMYSLLGSVGASTECLLCSCPAARLSHALISTIRVLRRLWIVP